MQVVGGAGKLLLLMVAVLTVGVASVALAKTASAETLPGRYIVVLDDSVDHPGRVATEHARRYDIDRSHTFRDALNGYAARIPARRVSSLRGDSRVRFVSQDTVIKAAYLPTGIERIDAEASSTASGDGSGSVNVNVAVLDGGIESDHPDLNVAGGFNCTNQKSGYDYPDFHGTHIGGTIAAKDNGVDDSSDGKEVVGVVPGAPLWGVRVLKKNGAGTASQVICGIDFVTSTRTDSDPNNDIAVANMSLGGKGRDDGNCGLSNKDALHLAICNSAAAGATYVVAAGNSGEDLYRHAPATYGEVLTVTAVADFDGQTGGTGTPFEGCGYVHTPDDSPAGFSNFATTAEDQAHTIAAPGVCILSTWAGPATPLGAYALLSGTSMAAPHVAGTVALCVATGSCTGTPQQIIQKLVSDAANYSAATPDYGFLGDPLRPMAGRFYGNLIRAGLY